LSQQPLTESQQREASEHLTHLADTGTFALKQSEFALLKQHLLSDPFDFARIICRYRELTDRYHRPLAYIAGQCTDKLIALLNRPGFDSYVLHALRIELMQRGIDWNTEVGRGRFEELLAFVNIRMYRGSGKSSIGTHSTLLWYATKDPNETIALMSVNDEGASAFCRQVRETMLSDIYRLFFPERIPQGDLTKLLTERRLWFGGRNIPHPQWTVEARGFTSSWARTHFNRFFCDDIVTEANCSETELPKVHRNLGNMRGLYMPEIKRKVCRHHFGTVYAETDDHSFLRKIAHCLTIVVPIETYPNGQPESIEERGIPTNPEWHPVEAVSKIQAEVSGDPDQGPLSYKRNFWLDPLAGLGDRTFPPSLVGKAKYRLVVEAGVKKCERPRRKEDGSYEPMALDPFRQMMVVLGIDPAFSKGGDDWAVSAVGVDHEEVVYQLETLAGKGWEGLKRAMRIAIERWNPRVVGYERAGAQETSFQTLLEYDKFFRRYAKLFEPVWHENKSKEWRILNRVVEPMRMGKLWVNPNDTRLHEEMTAYNPENEKAIDNRVDSIAIAMSLVRRGKPKGKFGERMGARKAAQKSRRDPFTGVKIR
jgi:hypothetical protein